MAKILYTSINRVRFNELMEGARAGTLSVIFATLSDSKDDLTKKQAVEYRQTRAFAMIMTEPQEKIAILKTDQWDTLNVYTDGTLEIIGFRRQVVGLQSKQPKETDVQPQLLP